MMQALAANGSDEQPIREKGGYAMRTISRPSLVAALVAALSLSTACSNGFVDTTTSGLSGASTTSPQPTTSVGSTTELATSTSQPGLAAPTRLTEGDLGLGVHFATAFAFPFILAVDDTPWATDGGSGDAIHFVQSAFPDFGASALYDFPTLVLVAIPGKPNDAVVNELASLTDLEFSTKVDVQLGRRSALRLEGTSAGNPIIPSLASADGASFSGLGGYWFWDPEVGNLRYVVHLVDMGNGTLVVWYAVPEAGYETHFASAEAVIDSLIFDEG